MNLTKIIERKEHEIYAKSRFAKKLNDARPTFLPLHLTGGIGDVIISVDSVRRLAHDFQVVVYSHHAEAFKYFFKDPIPVFHDLHTFDWHLEFNAVARFRRTEKFYGFLMKEHERLFLKQLDLFRRDSYFESMVANHPLSDFMLARHCRDNETDRRHAPIYSLGYAEQLPFATLPRQAPSDYITVHDGYDVTNVTKTSARITKTWKLEHWAKLVKKIKRQTGLKVIQLGAKSSRPIEGVDESFVNKKTLIESFDILARSRLHIDGDSGLVHAATRMQVPCVVMFGPTPDYFYGYPQNKNLRSGVCKDACYWLKPDWMNHCPIGYETPRCMDEISPDRVFSEAEALISGPH